MCKFSFHVDTVLDGPLKPLLSAKTLSDAVSIIKSKGKADAIYYSVDPLVYWQPNNAAFLAAQAGGPHLDAYGNPDPRTFQHVVNCFTQPLPSHAPAATQRAPV